MPRKAAHPPAAGSPPPVPSPAGGGGSRRGEAPPVLVGIVTAPHGVAGAVRIKSFTARPADIAGYGALADAAGRRFALTVVGAGKGVVIARLAGIEDRNGAEALRGLRLYLPRAALPPAAADEFYHADLLGLRAETPDGRAIGRVAAVHDFGAGDTLEIARHEAPPVVVPFTRAVVPVVDLDAGRLVVDPPPGLLDDAPKARHGAAEAGRSARGREPFAVVPAAAGTHSSTVPSIRQYGTALPPVAGPGNRSIDPGLRRGDG